MRKILIAIRDWWDEHGQAIIATVEAFLFACLVSGGWIALAIKQYLEENPP